MTDLFTRKEYMGSNLGDRVEARRLHRRYYAQFVNDDVINAVVRSIGADRILASTDEHLNDIPLQDWDRICGAIARGSDIQWTGGRVFRTAIKFEDVGDYATLAGLCCVAKEAARQYIERSYPCEPE